MKNKKKITKGTLFKYKARNGRTLVGEYFKYNKGIKRGDKQIMNKGWWIKIYIPHDGSQWLLTKN